MANINRSWKKIVSVGCSHGDMANKKSQQQVLDFCDRFKPDIRVELGDVVDTAAFRSGARGTPDEATKVEPDEFAAISWLERYHPNFITWGNHCDRLRSWQSSPNAIVSYAAGKLWNQLEETARKLKAKTRDYDFATGWFEIGGTFWGHGYWFNEAAVRDTAEYLGGPVVIAHLHTPQQVQGRTRLWTPSFCVGTLSDVPSMHYARRRRATSRWGPGCVYGYVSDKSSQLWLASCEPGGILTFPL